jgi:hypothetical protein
MDILSIFSIVGSLATAVGVFLLLKQIRDNQKTIRAQFISNLENEFAVLSDTYVKLLPGAVWSSEGVGPKDSSEVEKMITYLSFFLKLEHFIKLKALDLETADQLFAFRFFLIANNTHAQRHILYAPLYKGYWTNIFDLHRKWSEYRLSSKSSQEIPFIETELKPLGQVETDLLNAAPPPNNAFNRGAS